ncbi:MAG: histone deacetylase family protein [Actinomycetota bacterium]
MDLLIHVNPPEAEHRAVGHPERPQRIQACREALDGSGLDTEIVPASPADRADLEAVHPARYLDALERFVARGGGQIDPDTYAGARSFEVAVRAAGACTAAVDAAFADGRRSFCLVRPPGHHATPERGMGFCLVNHVAVGARRAIRTGSAERVAIVDIDVHHGNGTQDVFWEDDAILYVSLHQYPWYPGSGALEEVGAGAGDGTTLNVPLPAETGDATYLAAMSRVVVPALHRFRPGLLLVSAGFDAHRRDPLALMQVSAEGFGAMVAALVEAADALCEGRVVATLEGGYDLEGLSTSFVAALRALGGEAPAGPWPAPDPEGSREALERAESFHRNRGTLESGSGNADSPIE